AAGPEDCPRIAALYNEGIRGRMATFEAEERTAAERAAWLAGHDERHPVLVALSGGDGGTVLGWASLDGYRPRACYAGVAEFSIYVAAEARGRGVGAILLPALIDAAGKVGHWKVLSRVFVENAASRALCARCGFREVGVYERHARLDGQWRDVVIVERLIAADSA
ncbi:MAG: arsinothricin resistance N-acetyltransferase ArsN1 family A, partial [Thermomicrobiales bacterium]